MKVSALLHGRKTITLNDDDTVALAMQAMLWSDVRHIPVLRDGNVVGVVSERDLLAHSARRGKGHRGDLLTTIMSKPAITVMPETDVSEATELMLSRRLGCLPVVDGRALVGVITRSDIMAATRDHVAERADRQRLIRDLMKRAPLTARTGDTLLDAIGRMETNRVRHLPVIDGDGHLVGMLSDRDVRTAIGDALRPLGRHDAVVRLETMHVSDVMSRRPISIDEEATLAEAAALLALRRVGALAVVDGSNHLRGIVSTVDVLRAYADPAS